MKVTQIEIGGIPALIWGETSDKVLLCVHGKMASKECAEGIAGIAQEKGYQTVSFDLPQHGERKNEVLPSVLNKLALRKQRFPAH